MLLTGNYDDFQVRDPSFENGDKVVVGK